MNFFKKEVECEKARTKSMSNVVERLPSTLTEGDICVMLSRDQV